MAQQLIVDEIGIGVAITMETLENAVTLPPSPPSRESTTNEPSTHKHQARIRTRTRQQPG